MWRILTVPHSALSCKSSLFGGNVINDVSCYVAGSVLYSVILNGFCIYLHSVTVKQLYIHISKQNKLPKALFSVRLYFYCIYFYQMSSYVWERASCIINSDDDNNTVSWELQHIRKLITFWQNVTFWKHSLYNCHSFFNFFKPMMYSYIRCHFLPQATYHDVPMMSCLTAATFQATYKVTEVKGMQWALKWYIPQCQQRKFC